MIPSVSAPGRTATSLATVLVTVAAGAVVGACAGQSPDTSDGNARASIATTTQSARSPDDVTFLQGMIKHHEQGVELAALAPKRAGDAQLVALAQQIAAQQRTEIDGFRAQLLQWEEPLGAPSGMHIAGMAGRDTVENLKALHGNGFDRQWLEVMAAYHRGAVAMARDEAAHGASIDVVSIAKSVAASQQAELDAVNQLLGVAP